MPAPHLQKGACWEPIDSLIQEPRLPPGCSPTVPVAQQMQEPAAAICCTALPRQISCLALNLAPRLSVCVGPHQHEFLAVASGGGKQQFSGLTALSALLQVLAAKGAQHEARGEMLLSFMTGKPSALAAQAASTAAGGSLVGPTALASGHMLGAESMPMSNLAVCLQLHAVPDAVASCLQTDSLAPGTAVAALTEMLCPHSDAAALLPAPVHNSGRNTAQSVVLPIV